MLYYGIAHLGLSLDEVAEMPCGLINDLIECHMQWNGITRAVNEAESIDDIIPYGLD